MLLRDNTLQSVGYRLNLWLTYVDPVARTHESGNQREEVTLVSLIIILNDQRFFGFVFPITVGSAKLEVQILSGGMFALVDI